MPVAPFQYLNCHDKSHLITFAGTTSSDPLAPGNRDLFYRMQPLIVALYTCQGIPMLWEGEEFVDDYQLPPSGAARINLRRDVHWEYFYDDQGSPVVRLCRVLGALRASEPALRSRESYYYYAQSLVGNAILAYHRHAAAAGGTAEQFAMVVINFGWAEGQISLPFPMAGVWTEFGRCKVTSRRADAAANRYGCKGRGLCFGERAVALWVCLPVVASRSALTNDFEGSLICGRCLMRKAVEVGPGPGDRERLES